MVREDRCELWLCLEVLELLLLEVLLELLLFCRWRLLLFLLVWLV